jgi:hypothetical protein
MEFPPEILRLIREYSLPITRPNWRKSKPIITTYQMFLLAERNNTYFWTYNIYERLLEHIQETEWFYSYKTILEYGLDPYRRHYYYKYGVHSRNIHTIDGLQEALYIYNQIQLLNNFSRMFNYTC